jgi:hypothetical protein
MRADELWVESYQGEVLGEALFGLMAQRETDPARRDQLETLTLLERATKELAEPVLERRGLDRGDTDASLATAKEFADALAQTDWESFLRSLTPVTAQFLAKYEELVALSDDAEERAIAMQYCAHERALASFAHRSLGDEAGEPLEKILTLAHVAAARSSAA